MKETINNVEKEENIIQKIVESPFFLWVAVMVTIIATMNIMFIIT